jgi:hypothetical protein
LAIGAGNEEYPIRKETMIDTKRLVGELDEEGWGNYETTTAVRAAQIDVPFAVKRVGTEDINLGKPGDYVVDTGKRQFVVDQEIFKKTYTKLEE